MTLHHLALVLRARWRFALLVFLVITLAGVAAGQLRRPRFTASASVVLDVKSPDPIAGVVLPGMIASSYMATQIGVIQSERVLVRALRALGLDRAPESLVAWKTATDGRGDMLSWLAERCARQVELVPTKDANLITLSYTADSADEAAAMANAIVQAYIELTLELRVEPARQFNSFFEDKARGLRENVEAAQARILAFQQKNGILVGNDKFDAENQRLLELSSQLVALQAQLAESASRASQANVGADSMPEAMNNPLLIGLNTELAQREGKLAETTARLGDSHPDLVDQRARLTQLRERIALETRRVSAGMAANQAVNQSRVAMLRTAVAEQRTRLLALKGQRDELALLQRDAENAQLIHDQMLARATQSGMESQATQTNVSVLKRASPPAQPSSPRVLLNALVAALAGLLGALAASLRREAADRRLRSLDDIEHGLRQPVLAVLGPARGQQRSAVLQLARLVPAIGHGASVRPTPSAGVPSR